MVFICVSLLLLLLTLLLLKAKVSNGIALLIYSVFCLNLLLKIINYPIGKSTDYIAYSLVFSSIKEMSFTEMMQTDYFEYLFRIMSWGLLHLFGEHTFSIFVYSSNILIAIALYRLFKNKMLAPFALFIYTNGPTFFPMSTNIIRQVLVISLILIILSMRSRFKLVLAICLPFIHASSIVFAIYFFLHKYFKEKWLLVIAVITAIMFLTHLNQPFFEGLGYDSKYTEATFYELAGAESEGNRIDFFIFTTLTMVLAIYLRSKDQLSTYIYKYILLSGILFYCLGFQAFSDRLGIFVWYTVFITGPLLINYFVERMKFE